jgi:hypothetical protein
MTAERILENLEYGKFSRPPLPQPTGLAITRRPAEVMVGARWRRLDEFLLPSATYLIAYGKTLREIRFRFPSLKEDEYYSTLSASNL